MLDLMLKLFTHGYRVSIAWLSGLVREIELLLLFFRPDDRFELFGFRVVSEEEISGITKVVCPDLRFIKFKEGGCQSA
jgi:hypothetical protein